MKCAKYIFINLIIASERIWAYSLGKRHANIDNFEAGAYWNEIISASINAHTIIATLNCMTNEASSHTAEILNSVLDYQIVQIVVSDKALAGRKPPNPLREELEKLSEPGGNNRTPYQGIIDYRKKHPGSDEAMKLLPYLVEMNER